MYTWVSVLVAKFLSQVVCVEGGGGEGLAVPGGTLMTHGNSDVMEAQPQIDPSANVCVCVRQNKARAMESRADAIRLL